MSLYSNTSGRRSSASVSPSASPVLHTSSQFGAPHLPIPPSSYNASAGPSSTSLDRQGSSSSQRSSRPSLRGMIPSPRNTPSMPPPSSAGSSTSGSKSASMNSTPRLLSRRSSAKEGVRPAELLLRKVSGKGKAKEEAGSSSGAEGWRSSVAEGDSEPVEIIETPQMTATRDPETGRKMINQYVVMHEIGHGAHGQVRLGRDTSNDLEEDEYGPGPRPPSLYYAIKMVDRMPKRKKLQTLRKGYGRTDGGKMVGESEIRKEVAIFKKVHHPNIVSLKEIIDDPEQSKIFMILEYCEKGEIKWKADDGGPLMTIEETRNIFRDTLSGLAYLHHQGIIHRDIKPSNLLLSADNTVKISDFGCSHYSEALRTASAQPGPEGDRYVDDVELAKTAGSPAFFAPEMCYSGLDDDVSSTRDNLSPLDTPSREVPGFTLRPPSVASEFGESPRPSRSDPLVMSPGGRTIPLKQIKSNDSSAYRRPVSVRSHSSHTVNQRKEQRLPITNAIDVWALGVTLYCLLFGRTPFDAPNEYLLMQVIPTAEFEIPATMGRDRLPTSGSEVPAEVREAIDLLRGLLEKVPGKRLTLEQAKRHPFTLRGLHDPTAWLTSADPHTRDFVTVSNDEVLAAVIPGSFRARLKKSIKVFSNKLHLFSGSRNRGRSVTEFDQNGLGPADYTPATSTHGSHVNLTAEELAGIVSPASTVRGKTRNQSMSRDASPLTSPQTAGSGSVARRFSILGSKPALNPHPHTVQLGSPSLGAQAESIIGSAPTFDGLDRTPMPYVATPKSGFSINRTKVHAPSHLLPPTTKVPISDAPRSPVKMASSASLDKYAVKPPTVSPPASMRRRMSDIEIIASRERHPSNASSAQASMSGFGKLVKLLSRTSSSRSGSRFSRRSRADHSAGSDMDDHAVSASASPVDALRRISLEADVDAALSRRSHDASEHDGVTSSSYSSRAGAMSSPEHSVDSRVHNAMQWSSRLPAMGIIPIRRNSSPITAVSAFADAEDGPDAEEVAESYDWDGRLSDASDVSDGEDFDETPNFSSPAYKGVSPFGGSGFGSPFREVRERDTAEIGLIARQLQNSRSSPVQDIPPTLPPLALINTLEAIPDASPPDHIPVSEPSHSVQYPLHTPRTSTSPSNAMGMLDLNGHQYGYGFGSGAYRSPSRTTSRGSGSPYRSTFNHDRARSPLGRQNEEDDILRSRRGSVAHSHSPLVSSPSHIPGTKLESGSVPTYGHLHNGPQHFETTGTSLSPSHTGSPRQLSLARQSSSGSGFGSLRNGPVTPGSGSASCVGGLVASSPSPNPIEMGRTGVSRGRREVLEGGDQEDEEEEEGLAIVFGSKRGRKASVMGRKVMVDESGRVGE